ncbi:MAG TPA: bifunctional ADP-heptose synthase [Saprospiraceae bacterium]|nr:bifunctional ADP-heptose synthase [Saprospiraceae bacterium]
MFEWNNFFDKIQGERVLVIGDIMLDRYLYGQVDRISPEAPVPVVSLQKEEEKLGGAANVALNLKALGCEVFLIGSIGLDASGEKLKQILPEQGIGADYLVEMEHRKTTVKSRVIGGSQHLLRVDSEDLASLDEKQSQLVFDKYRRCIDEKGIQLVLVQDYDKGLLTDSLLKRLLNFNEQRGIFTSIDPKKHDLCTYSPCQLLKPNWKEFQAHFGARDWTPEARLLEEKSEALKNNCELEKLLITLSDQGVFYFDGVKNAWTPTQSREIVDVCGAGDAVFAIATLAAKFGLSGEDIGRLSNIAGGLVCQHLGVVAVKLSEMRQELKKQTPKMGS